MIEQHQEEFEETTPGGVRTMQPNANEEKSDFCYDLWKQQKWNTSVVNTNLFIDGYSRSKFFMSLLILPHVTPSCFDVTLYIFASNCDVASAPDVICCCDAVTFNCFGRRLDSTLCVADNLNSNVLVSSELRLAFDWWEITYSSVYRTQIAANVVFVTKSAQMISPFSSGL